ncbi:MAG: ATP-binding protein, partial [Lachnospiraceae bacterium]|nr:ATP-binding protein [Lachnospiraceae bacterium]
DNGEFYESSYQDEYLLNKLVQENSRQTNIFDEIIVNDKLDEIMRMLKEVTPGNLKKNNDLDEYYIQYDNVPLNIKNLSTGIKAFMIIRTLLEKNVLKKKDIIILDEPEIHLHPQWQLIYAELIVLLEKSLDLSIIITTHSPYFLDAINTYSKHHGISEKTNFYLSDIEGKQAIFEDVTDNLEKIYEKLAKPFDELDSIKYN